MGDALVLEIAESHRPQLGKGQVLQIRVGTVQSVAQDIAVDSGRQQVTAAALCQLLPQLRGGDIHHPWNGQGKNAGLGIGFIKIVPLGGKQFLRVRLRPAKGRDARQ